MKIKTKVFKCSATFLLFLFTNFLVHLTYGQNKSTTDIKILVVSPKDSALGNASVWLQSKSNKQNVKLELKTNEQGLVTFKNVTASNQYDLSVELSGYEDYTRDNYQPNKGRVNSLMIKLKKKIELDDVVVTTALGIKRQERSLGYSTSVVKGEQLTEALSNNWMDALSGKVAGVNLLRSNSGPTGSIKVILRGENNLTGDNEALIVVDGVVISNSSGRRTAVNGEATYGTNNDNMPADYGSTLNDLNPEDIESVTVLKGPGAAALYGQRGANGALIITTKSGKKNNKGFGVTLNSNYSVEKVNRWPGLQYEYGQGLGGSDYYSYGTSPSGQASTSGTSSAYGPKFDGQLFYQYDPLTQAQGKTKTPWMPYKNKMFDFFDAGKNATNTITLSGGTDRTTARFSFTNVNDTWILPNTGYKRNSVSMSVNSKINDKLQVSSTVNYNNKWSDNLPGAGYGNQSLMYWFIFWQPNADPDWLKNYWENGKEGSSIKYPFSSYPTNPYAVSYEYLNKSNRQAVTGNVQGIYSFSKEWSLKVRSSIDLSYENRSQQRPWGAGAKYPKGSYRTQNIFSMEASTDFLLTYNKKINNNFSLAANIGGSTLTNKYNKDEVRADSLMVSGIYSMSNNRGPLVTLPYKSEYKINSLYALLTLNYKSLLYADFTARKDWNSTLATPQRTDNSGFFYPSANFSFIPSDAFKLPTYIDYMKLRFSVSGVGSCGTTPYLTDYNYETAGSLYNGGLQVPSVLTNPNLQSLRTITYELGTNIQFLKNRISVDVAVYNGTTKDQIFNQIVDWASGYGTRVINLGKVRNTGVEVTLNTRPIVSKNFIWSSNLVFSSNRNKIVELGDSSVILSKGPVGGGQIVAKAGGSMGDLYGNGYVRDPNGNVVYDATTGFAKLDPNIKYLGNTIPKYKVGWTNDFSYKAVRLHLLFDAQFGAVGHSLSHYKLAEQGKTINTLPGRYNGIIGNGVVQNDDGTYSKNTTIATDIDNYYRSQYGQDNAEGSTFSTNFIKFREARFDYVLNANWAKRIGFQRASVGVYGRNLFIWSPWPMFDPEFGTLSGTDIVRGFEIAQFPSTRTFGANIVLGF